MRFSLLSLGAVLVSALLSIQTYANNIPDPFPVSATVADPNPVAGLCACDVCECPECECGIRAALATLTTMAAPPRSSCPTCVNGACVFPPAPSCFAPAPLTYSLASAPLPNSGAPNPYPVIPPGGLETGPVVVGPAPVVLPLRPIVQAAHGHTHTCSRGHTWDHSQDGGSHNCPICHEHVTTVSHAGATNVGGAGATFASYSGYSAGVSSGCSSGSSFGTASNSRASGRQPVLRIAGGPGLLKSVFGGGSRGGCR